MILSIIGIISLIAGIVFLYMIKVEAFDKKIEDIIRKLGKLGIIFGVVITLLAQTIVIIPTNHTGVRTTFGQISGRTLNNGLQFKIPFVQKIEKVNNKLQDITIAGSEQIWSETINRTALFYQGITITYQINAEKSAWIYANITNYERNLISIDLVASSIKSISKTLSDEDATNRNIVEPLIMKSLQADLDEKYGKDVVLVRKAIVNNIDFEESYNTAIAEKQSAQIEYEKQQIKNKQLVEEQEAKAEAKVKEAEGEAKAKLAIAQAEAQANELLKSSISKEVLQSKVLDKWNGELPKAVSDSSSFILDIFNQQ